MEELNIDEIALSLIREYLSSKNLKDALKCIDSENPRTAESINNRATLIKLLHLERKMKQNKEKPKPLMSILEVLVKNYLERNAISNRKESVKTKGKLDESLTKFKNLNQILPELQDRIEIAGTEVQSDKIHQFSRPNQKQVFMGDLTVDDVEDMEEFNSQIPLNKLVLNTNACDNGVEISFSELKKLKQLLFGSTTGNFNAEWKIQNFKFAMHSLLAYGLVQKKGGPCGIMACLQSFIIKELLFPANRQPIGLAPTAEQQDQVLAAAICHILWQAGQKQKAVVATFNICNMMHRKHEYNSRQADVPLDNLKLSHCSSYDTLEACVKKKLPSFKHDDMSGCISLLCSAIFSRGIENIRSEMDEHEGQLLGAHGYCTQEIVNLLLTGHAVSNVFDGIVELESGGNDKMLLRGIDDQSSIGFLSLFEHYRSCEVGRHLKFPVYPIWVICSESHFSVIFSKDRLLTQGGNDLTEFDLFLYDGLMRQESEIRLAIELPRKTKSVSDDDLIPPIELCIRTKWPSAIVTWLGCDPIL